MQLSNARTHARTQTHAHKRTHTNVRTHTRTHKTYQFLAVQIHAVSVRSAGLVFEPLASAAKRMCILLLLLGSRGRGAGSRGRARLPTGWTLRSGSMRCPCWPSGHPFHHPVGEKKYYCCCCCCCCCNNNNNNDNNNRSR